MRRLSVLACLLATLFGVIAGTGIAAASPGAETTSAAAVANCYGHTVRSASYVRNNLNGYKWGAVQLCQDGNQFFAVYINYADDLSGQGPMVAGTWANAWIYRYHNGQYYGRMSCDNYGNGHVTPGRIACYTGRSTDGDGVSFRAEAYGYVIHNGESVWAATGATATI